MDLSSKLTGFETVTISKPVLDAGAYIFLCEKEPTDEWDDKKDLEYLAFEYKVLDGPPQEKEDPEFGTSAAGRTASERVYLDSKNKWKLKKLMVAMGLLDRNDTTSDRARGNFGTEIFAGQTFHATIVHNTGKDGTGLYANINPVIE